MRSEAIVADGPSHGRRHWAFEQGIAWALEAGRRLAVAGLAHLFVAYLRVCYATSKLACSPESEWALDGSVRAGRNTLLVFWHDEFMLTGLLSFISPLKDGAAVTNDSFGGAVMEKVVRLLGAKSVRIGLRESREERIGRIAQAVRAHRMVAIAAAYGEPWFKARPTSLQIAAGLDGCVLAIHIETNRRLLLRTGAWRAYLPLPFSRYVLQISTPLRPKLPLAELKAAKLEEKLWGLRSAALH